MFENTFAKNRTLLCGEGSTQASPALNVLYLITLSPSMRRKVRTSAAHFLALQFLRNYINYFTIQPGFKIIKCYLLQAGAGF